MIWRTDLEDVVLTLGMNYDVGAFLTLGRPSRPHFDVVAARAEIEAIAQRLHCTALRFTGEDPGRLKQAAELALGEGMTVYLSPVKHNLTPPEALRYLAGTARLAEDLRARRGGPAANVAGVREPAGALADPAIGIWRRS